MLKDHSDSERGNPKEGRKEMFYLMEGNVLFNDALDTFFIYGYMVSDI